ncbi:MAG: hypothetical protein J0L92_24525 [Deltaproteobacteria bacterium]|nr:hypothetical protein [Deltaproteobacteria bacterium]
MSPTRLTLLGVGLASAIASSGCAQNALFELYVELPPAVMIEGGGAANFARVVALPAIADRGTTLDGSRSRIVELGRSRQVLGVTLLRNVGFTERELTVRVIYCTNDTECDPVETDTWAGFEDLVFERAFFVGRTSCYAHSLTDQDFTDGLTLPSDSVRVSACGVGGCTDDDFSEEGADFCRLGTTTHFCEAGQQGNVCDRLHDLMEPMLAPGG